MSSPCHVSPWTLGTCAVVQPHNPVADGGMDVGAAEDAAIDFGSKGGFALRTEPHLPSQQNTTTAAISAAHAEPCN